VVAQKTVTTALGIDKRPRVKHTTLLVEGPVWLYKSGTTNHNYGVHGVTGVIIKTDQRIMGIASLA
jgi:hypothetical protein